MGSMGRNQRSPSTSSLATNGGSKQARPTTLKPVSTYLCACVCGEVVGLVVVWPGTMHVWKEERGQRLAQTIFFLLNMVKMLLHSS